MFAYLYLDRLADMTDLAWEAAAMHASHGPTIVEMPDGFEGVSSAERWPIVLEVLYAKLRELGIRGRRR